MSYNPIENRKMIMLCEEETHSMRLDISRANDELTQKSL